TFAAGVTQPIFFGGELQAAQHLRTAEQKAAAASYVGSALRAFEDVEDALAGDYYLRKREGALADAVSNSGEAVNLGGKQLEQGQIDMFTILRLTGENLAAKVQLTQIRASRLRERVNLYLALGGDFNAYACQGKPEAIDEIVFSNTTEVMETFGKLMGRPQVFDLPVDEAGLKAWIERQKSGNPLEAAREWAVGYKERRRKKRRG